MEEFYFLMPRRRDGAKLDKIYMGLISCLFDDALAQLQINICDEVS